MKVCTNCHLSFDDQANICARCGNELANIAPQQTMDPTDHTAEFNAADISQNKVIAAAVLGVVNIICFFSVCSGKAKEPAIVSGLKFLK